MLPYLIFTLAVLIFTLILYKVNRTIRFKIVGITFGVISMLFYWALNGLNLASTPANYVLRNLTKRHLKTFFILGSEKSVIEHHLLAPNEQTRAPGFETEGSSEIWVITTLKDNTLFSVDKIKDKLYEEKIFIASENSPHSIQSSDKKEIESVIKSFFIEKYLTISFVLINILVLIFFVFYKVKR